MWSPSLLCWKMGLLFFECNRIKWARYNGRFAFLDSYSNQSVIIWVCWLAFKQRIHEFYIHTTQPRKCKQKDTKSTYLYQTWPPIYHLTVRIYTDILAFTEFMATHPLHIFINHITNSTSRMFSSTELQVTPSFKQRVPALRSCICGRDHIWDVICAQGHAFAWEAALWFASDLGFARGAAIAIGRRGTGFRCNVEMEVSYVYKNLA